MIVTIATTVAIDKTMEFLIEKGMDYMFSHGMEKVVKRLARDPVDAAYQRALKKWCRNEETRKKYAIAQYSHFEEFRKYLAKGPSGCTSELLSLCKLFEDELKKSPETFQFIEDLRLQSIQTDLKESFSAVCEQHKELLSWLQKIDSTINSPFKLEPSLETSVLFDKETYIPRKCSCVLDEHNSLDKYLHPEKYPQYSLIDYVIGNEKTQKKKLLLCGDAQSGKTTELKHLFHELYESGLFRLYYREIKGWKFDLPDLSEAEQRETIIIIDALDERFDDTERNELFNSIENYATRQPYLSMVVSCRSNFKETSLLGSFECLQLQDLEWDDAKEIIRSRCINPESLIEEIKNKHLFELVEIPLFLIALIDCFNQNNHIPETKPEIYEYLILSQLRAEEEKSLVPHPRMLSKGLKALEGLALGLQLMEKNTLSEDELLDLFDDKEEWNRIQRSGLVENNKKEYAFVHNSFKEYLVSVFLKRLNSLDEMQKLCCYSEVKIIKATWYNVIVLYLSQLSNNNPLFVDLIEWLEKDNEEMLLYVESGLVDEKKRCDLYIGILEECKKKGILFGSRNEKLVEALMKFGQGTESVNYIISELNNVLSYDTHVSNILWTIQYMNWGLMASRNSQLSSQLESAILGLFRQFVNDEKAWAIWNPFDNRYYHNKGSIDGLLGVINESRHPNIWNSFIRLVVKAHMAKEYLDIILEKCIYVHDYKSDGIIHSIPPVWINEALSVVESKDGLLKILVFLEKGISDRKKRLEFSSNHKRLVAPVVSNAEKVIPQEELKEILIRLYEAGIDPFSSRGEIQDFIMPVVAYFEKQGLSEDLFFMYADRVIDSIDNEKKWWFPEKYSKCASFFCSEERLFSFATKNKDTEIGYRSFRCLCGYSPNFGRIAKEYFPSYYVNVENYWQDREKQELAIFFEYDAFKAEVLRLLTQYSGDRKGLSDYLDNYDDSGDKLNKYVYWFFIEFSEKQQYQFDKVKEYIESLDFYHWFLLKETKEYCGPDSKELNDEQKAIVIQIAKDLIVRFANGEDNIHLGYAYYPLEMLLNGSVGRINDFDYLKLLPYSFDVINNDNKTGYYTLFDFIASQSGVDIQKIFDYIVSNVEFDQKVPELNQWRWTSFILENEIERGYPIIVEWAKKDNWGRIIQMFVENPKTRSIIENKDVLEQFPMKSRLTVYWDLVRLKGYDASWIKGELEQIFDNLDEADSLSAAKMLLMLGSIKGLQYANSYPGFYEKEEIAPNYDKEEALPFLFDALGLLMERKNGIEGARLYEAKLCVISSIGKIAAQSSDAFYSIEKKIDELVSPNKEKYSELYYYVSNWKSSLYAHMTKNWNIDEIKGMLMV